MALSWNDKNRFYNSIKKWIPLFMVSLLFVVLYCEKKHGAGKKLADFSSQTLPRPPAWAKKGVLYELFPRVFTPEGTFHALEKRLDYIRNLGVNIIWLMPINPIGEKGRKGKLGCPYSVKDFRAINPEYGSKEDFRKLVKAIHQRGMKVIIGIVPNHASNDNVLMKEHPGWFIRDKKGHFTREVEEWSDVTDFNYDNPQMREYMLETLLFWIEEFDIDGYRCDVAGMVPYDFWEKAIPGLKAVKPDIFLLAEWEDPKILLTGFNSDYGWTEYHLLNDIRHNRKRTVAAIDLIYQKDSRYPRNVLPMRFLENHDELRSLDRFGPQAIEGYATFLFTLPGIPLIYAGQEMGAVERPSLFEKSVLPWESADAALLKMYKNLIQLRKTYSCFTEGNFIPLQTASFSGSVGAFLRENQHSAALVICNLRNTTARKVVVTMKDELRQKLKSLAFENFKNPGDKISFSEIVFNQVLPYQTVVYLAKK